MPARGSFHVVGAGAHAVVDLGRHDEALALPRHPVADDLLGAADRLERSADRVDVGHVDEINPGVLGRTHDRERLAAIGLQPEGHRTQAEQRARPLQPAGLVRTSRRVLGSPRRHPGPNAALPRRVPGRRVNAGAMNTRMVGVLGAAVMLAVAPVTARAAGRTPPTLTPLVARDVAAACPGTTAYAEALVRGITDTEALAAAPLFDACAARSRRDVLDWPNEAASTAVGAIYLSRALLNNNDPGLLKRAIDATGGFGRESNDRRVVPAHHPGRIRSSPAGRSSGSTALRNMDPQRAPRTRRVRQTGGLDVPRTDREPPR